jgi:hypothetical protein
VNGYKQGTQTAKTEPVAGSCFESSADLLHIHRDSL